MTKKEIGMEFLKLASAGKVKEAYDNYVHSDFRHHLIFIKGDRASFAKAMEENARQFPHKTYETIHALEDGDFVAVHGKVKLDQKVYGVMHIFRFNGDKIIESWEASQEELKDSPNKYGLF